MCLCIDRWIVQKTDRRRNTQLRDLIAIIAQKNRQQPHAIIDSCFNSVYRIKRTRSIVYDP